MSHQASHRLPQAPSLPSTRCLPLDAMRTFLVALVVAHHSAMAYLPEAPPVASSLVAAPRWWQAFPIVDPATWSGFGLFVALNDTFFMAAPFPSLRPLCLEQLAPQGSHCISARSIAASRQSLPLRSLRHLTARVLRNLQANRHRSSVSELLEAVVCAGFMACRSLMVSLDLACVRPSSSRIVSLRPAAHRSTGNICQELSSFYPLRYAHSVLDGLLRTHGPALRLDVLVDLRPVLGTDQPDLSLPRVLHCRLTSRRHWSRGIGPALRKPTRQTMVDMVGSLYRFLPAHG